MGLQNCNLRIKIIYSCGKYKVELAGELQCLETFYAATLTY